MKKLLLCILVSFTIGISLFTFSVFNLETSLFSTAIIPAGILIYILRYLYKQGVEINYSYVFLFRIMLCLINLFALIKTPLFLDFDYRNENYILLDDEVSYDDGEHSGTTSSFKFYLDVNSNKTKILTEEGFLLKDRSNNWTYHDEDDQDYALGVNQGYVHEKEIAVMQEYVNAETMVNDTNPLMYGIAIIKEHIYRQGIYDLIFGLLIFIIGLKEPSLIFEREEVSNDPYSSFDRGRY